MRSIAASTLLICLLAGCGQVGPLYLPGEEPPVSQRRPSTAEPAASETQPVNSTEETE